MLTMKTRYAFKALATLAERQRPAPTLVGELAQRNNIPRKFLEAILRELRLHGFVSAKRGRGGGYVLRLEPEQITLAAIIRALEGPAVAISCGDRRPEHRCDECADEHERGVRLVLRDLYDATTRVLEHTTLADLLRRTRALNLELTLVHDPAQDAASVEAATALGDTVPADDCRCVGKAAELNGRHVRFTRESANAQRATSR